MWVKCDGTNRRQSLAICCHCQNNSWWDWWEWIPDRGREAKYYACTMCFEEHGPDDLLRLLSM